MFDVRSDDTDEGGLKGRMARVLELTNTPSAFTVPSKLASKDFVLRPGPSRLRIFLLNWKIAILTGCIGDSVDIGFDVVLSVVVFVRCFCLVM